MRQPMIMADSLKALEAVGFPLEQMLDDQREVVTTLSYGELKILLASKEQLDISGISPDFYSETNVGYFIY